MTLPTLAIQTAIYSALEADTGAGGLFQTGTPMITGVFDTVNENQAYPYVTIPDLQNNEFGSATFDGVEGQLNVNVWSQKASSLECKTIASRIYQLLHLASLSLSGGFTLMQMRFDFEQYQLDPDGLTHHGVLRFKYMVTN
jgi:hypothetical protein